MPKVLLKGGHLDNAVNVWTRHASPVALCHVIVSGASGRQFLNHVDETAAGLFVVGHPTLGDWSAVPALAKTVEGHTLHRYMGHPETPIDPLSSEEFAALNILEIWFRGHMTKYANGWKRNGGEFCGFAWSANTLRDALLPTAIAWETGDDWGPVSDQYKNDDGSPRVDPDEGIVLVEIVPPGE